ncbi:hypothetical protein [Streptomyces anulatus]|uniref:hypothetical protein n=1 Tax=Streptomyces anulatus TaxID=1892 RepID=UPI001C252AE9|nr:hypothetical protein [Streptomyces anulatus]
MPSGDVVAPGPDEESACRVCGHDDGDLFWEGGWPTALICVCCGNESDVSDASLMGVRNYRGYWTGNGAAWHSPSFKPPDWAILEQLARIPAEWR